MKKSLKSEEEWRRELTPEQFRVCRQKGTEKPFSERDWDCAENGVYCCMCCGSELFSSAAKYDSGTGWPSFTAPVGDEAIRARADSSHGMNRVEVLCSACDAYLGHVFEDGPPPAHRRYCMNSVALKFVSKE